MRAKEIVRATGGVLISGDPEEDLVPSRFFTDSRTIAKGGLFIAIEGPHFDGNDFAAAALRKGAAGAIVSRRTRALFRHAAAGKVVIAVKDTTAAYGAVARCHRMRFAIPVVGVTGSNGKTTTKEMCAHVLSGKYAVLRNEGTKNNHIGVPATLLQIDEETDVAVVEIGMNHAGEIRALASIARPTMAVLTNVGPSHLEFLGSLDRVFRAKRELVEGLPSGSTVIMNGDDRYFARMGMKRLRAVTFGFGEGNDFRASRPIFEGSSVTFLLNGRHQFRLRLLGRHNIYNALAAIAVGSLFKLGLSRIRERLALFLPEGMRCAPSMLSGIEFINDAYNSNPLSMKCALEALANRRTKGRRFVISGDMFELGDAARSSHEEIGRRIAGCGVDFLFTLGPFSKATCAAAAAHGMGRARARHLRTHDEAARLLRRMARRDDVVLVKGSRGMRMEKVIDMFKKAGAR